MAYDCVIVFDQNEHGTYFTGQVMTGRVHISFSRPKKLKGIMLQICGFASCQWRERHGRKHAQPHTKKPRKHCFYGREDYIASTTYLVGSDENKHVLMEGSHTYPFSCPIPINCPSSFEGTYGYIRYLTKVTFIRSGASNRTINKGFTVLKLSDLNNESSLLRSPADSEAIENFCFFHSKAVEMHVDLLQTGYVPGQNIYVNMSVDNKCSIDCKKIQLSLNLRATYQSDVPRLHVASEKICLVKKFCGSVPRNSRRNFTETIRVPATAPTCEHLSKVVRVSYEICVTAIMNHLMYNPRTTIPITIGNVPLTNGANPLPRADEIPTTSACAMQLADGKVHNLFSEEIEIVDELTTEDTETDGDADTEWELEPADTMELPPPTYEEAMFMTANIADDDVNTVSESANFTPRYPVYNEDMASSVSGQGPPPNMPQKRRRRRRKRRTTVEKERPPVESPIQI